MQAEKSREKEAQRLQQLDEAAATGGAPAGSDDDDDEMGWEARKRGGGAAAAAAGRGGGGAPAGGYIYALSPEQLKELEAKDTKRLEEQRWALNWLQSATV